MAPPLSKSISWKLFVPILLVVVSKTPSSIEAFQESCSSSADICTSLLGYSSPSPQRLQQIASLFTVDAMDVMGANDFDPTAADLENVIIQTKQFLKIPVTCSCIDKVHRVNSTVYTVVSGDYLSKIADSYGQLITYQQIAAANNIADPTKIFPGQKFVIPFPCACLNGGVYNNHPVVSLAYAISPGDTLTTIAAKTGAEAGEITKLNGLNSSALANGVVLDVPVPACPSSFNATATDYKLTVARGSYSITADHCVQCSCGLNSSSLYCSRAPDFVSGSCPTMQCHGTKLEIGEIQSKPSSKHCNVTSCLYDGYEGNTIFSRIQTTQQSICPAPMHAPAYVPVNSGPSSLPPVSAPPPPPPSSPTTVPPPATPSTGAKPPSGPQSSLGLHSYGTSSSLVMLTALTFLSMSF